MAVAFLAETVDAVRDLSTSAGRRRVRFFDGPFWIDIAHEATGAMSLSAGSRTDEDQWTGTVDSEAFVNQLKVLAHEVVNACHDHGLGRQGDVLRLTQLLNLVDG